MSTRRFSSEQPGGWRTWRQWNTPNGTAGFCWLIGVLACLCCDCPLPLASQSHNTLLYYAAHLGDVDVIGMLLENHAAVDSRNREGMTPLMAACLHGRLLAARALLAAAADVNARDTFGRTSLIHGAMGGHVDVVKELLAHHADKGIKDEVRLCVFVLGVFVLS